MRSFHVTLKFFVLIPKSTFMATGYRLGFQSRQAPVFQHFLPARRMSGNDVLPHAISMSVNEKGNPRWEEILSPPKLSGVEELTVDNFSTKVFNLCDVRTKVWIRWILMGLRRQSIEPLLATSPSLYMMLGNSSPALLQLIAEDKIPNGRVLVPGCGRGYDVVTLASKKRVVTGLEISATAVDAARDMLKSLPPDEQPPEGSANFQLTNFFDMPTEKAEEKFDFIYDYTFLCALNPSIREMWASKMADLVKPGGELVTLIYPISEDKEDGPPFRVSLEVVRNLLVPVGFEQLQLELLPFELCHPGREGVSGPYSSGIGRWKRNIN